MNLPNIFAQRAGIQRPQMQPPAAAPLMPPQQPVALGQNVQNVQNVQNAPDAQPGMLPARTAMPPMQAQPATLQMQRPPMMPAYGMPPMYGQPAQPGQPGFAMPGPAPAPVTPQVPQQFQPAMLNALRMRMGTR
jgi:hypothetical protein